MRMRQEKMEADQTRQKQTYEECKHRRKSDRNKGLEGGEAEQDGASMGEMGQTNSMKSQKKN